MRNGSSSICCSSSPVAMGLPQVLGSQAPHHGWWYRQLNASAREVTMEAEEMVRMPLLNGLVSLNVLLLVAYLLLFLLAKLFHRLCRARDHGRDSRTEIAGRSDNTVLAAAAAADVAAGERQADTMFWFDEAVFHHDTALLDDQGKDHLSYTGGGAAHGLQADGSCTFPAAESTARISFSPRQEDHPCDDDEAAAAAAAVANGKDQGESKDILTVSVAADVPTAPDEYHRQNIPVDVTPENVSVQVSEKPKGRGGQDGHDGHGEEEEEAGIPDVKRLVNSRALADTKKVLLPEGGGGGGRLLRPRRDEEEDNGDSSCRFGASTLTSESTSKSSVEWHGSGATKDAYSDLFSSSSRRSSARWESYTLFRKYDEDMVYFHRVGAQKLTETESFRSIKYQPRSMSQRITHKLSMAPTPPPIGLRDPYPELERVYVAQICLTWEALNWNYTSFRRHNGGGGGGTMTMLEDRCCPARVAQEFQQFQVLLYRFIENEPFEQGRRPEIYARMKNSSPKLLLVPEFREEEDEKDDLISAVQFLHILEESIRTFMAFLRADKRSHYQMFREMVRRRTSAADQAIVITLKKANKHKKSRLKDLTRPRRCLKRSKARDDEVVPVLLGLIDLKVVARVLRMPEITDQQLHWCEEKMNRVRVDVRQGKLQRDPSPLFFPAH